MSCPSALVALALLAAGCVSIENQWSGEMPSRAALARLQAGQTTLAQALALLGAPVEFHQHPDGLLAVYRLRSGHDLRIGLDPAMLLRFLPMRSVATQAAQNLKYVRETGDEDEDRVVLLFDDRRILAAHGQYLGARPR